MKKTSPGNKVKNCFLQMNKTQLSQQIAAKVGLSKSQAKIVLNTLLSAITKQVFSSRGAEVCIKDFGVFRAVPGHSSGVFDFSTGKQKTLPGPIVKMNFRPGSDLKKIGVLFWPNLGTRNIGITNEKLK